MAGGTVFDRRVQAVEPPSWDIIAPPFTGIDDEYDYIIFDCPTGHEHQLPKTPMPSHGYIIPVVPEAVMEIVHRISVHDDIIDSKVKGLAPMGDPRKIHVPDTELLLDWPLLESKRPVTHTAGIPTTIHLRSLESRWANLLIVPHWTFGCHSFIGWYSNLR